MDNIPVSDVSDELQCPVCLLIPREVPIPACPVGHITCKDCIGNVTTCPTCRRQMLKDGTNTLANKMIERVPHPCKFSPCKVKNYLKEIKDHEARCPERTVKCPYLFCKERVKVREYQKHAIAKKSTCNNYSDNLLTMAFITSFQVKTGMGENLETVLSNDWNWLMNAFEDRGKLFYSHMHYFAPEKTFVFYVTMPEHFNETKKYHVKMTLKNQNDGRKSLSIVQNVISMDLAPSDSKLVLASESVMFVHWRTMSRFMKWRNDTEDGKEVTKSYVEATVAILVN